VKFLEGVCGPQNSQLDFGFLGPDHDPGIFKPPPPVGAGGGYMFSGRPCVSASVRP